MWPPTKPQPPMTMTLPTASFDISEKANFQRLVAMQRINEGKCKEDFARDKKKRRTLTILCGFEDTKFLGNWEVNG